MDLAWTPVMLTDDQILRYARPGPRYTSYPTVPDWDHEPPDARLWDEMGALEGPVSVYVHVPFCSEQCSFCGCNMVVSGLRAVGDRYLDVLEKQVLALPLPADRVPCVRLHLGGGTPTWLSPEQMDRLFSILSRRFSMMTGAEIGVEVDPEITTDDHVHALARVGVTRLSVGVQSLDPVVLQAVRRPQRSDRVERVMRLASDYGMKGLNIDLMYGLPHQTVEGFLGTLDGVLAFGPDRLALFGYAHVPWLKPHQRTLDEAALPGPLVRARMYIEAQRYLLEHGYQAIGLDHFARDDDSLAVASRAGRLRRDFMGYTDRPRAPMIGLGVSAISELPGGFVQQRSKLGQWYRSVEKGMPLLERGIRLSDDDRARSAVIERLMCAMEVRFEDIEREHGVRFLDHFAPEVVRLRPFEDEGLVHIDEQSIRVPEGARLLLRPIAQTFDAYRLAANDGGAPRFSASV